MLDFVAIDFETANRYPNSACSLAVATVKNGDIVKTTYHLIRPPRMQFDPACIQVHGILPKEVEKEPSFDVLWRDVFAKELAGQVVVAHNAKFDITVLRAMLSEYKIDWPEFSYGCTVKLSRKVWPDLENHKLNTMGAFLGVDFKHHYALDDAETCAKIVQEANAKLGTSSIESLMDKVGLKLDPFMTEEERQRQLRAQTGEQLSLF